MSYLECKKQIIEQLKQNYSDTPIEVETIEYGGNITAFFLKLANGAALDRLWSAISGEIAFHFQAELESDFERWNIYIFYLVTGEVGKGLKFKIENDPISSRKIVLDKFKDQTKAEIISDHITNDNLILAEHASTKAKEFTKNIQIVQALSYLRDTKKKRDYDEAIKASLDQLENSLRK